MIPGWNYWYIVLVVAFAIVVFMGRKNVTSKNRRIKYQLESWIVLLGVTIQAVVILFMIAFESNQWFVQLFDILLSDNESSVLSLIVAIPTIAATGIVIWYALVRTFICVSRHKEKQLRTRFESHELT